MRVRSFGSCAVFARGFGFANRGHLTVILKASGCFDPVTGEVSWSASSSIVSGERPARNRAGASLEHASDVALFVPRAEVMVMGHAHAPESGPVEESIVGLDLVRAGVPVFSKSLRVTGDRRGDPRGSLPPPTPFDVMPLVYERSPGGRSSGANPVGVGEDLSADGTLTLPNITALDSRAPHVPLGFGPIASTWPIRSQRRGTVTAEELENQSWVDLPPGFDQSYFQAAPPDQTAADLWGGDVVQLRGMNSAMPTMRMVVPLVAATGLLVMPRGERRLLALRLDTIFVSAASCSCEFLFRTNTAFDRRDLESAFVAGALHPVGVPFVFPHSFDESAPPGRSKAIFGTDVIELPKALSFEEPSPATVVFDDEPPRTMIFEEPPPRTVIFDADSEPPRTVIFDEPAPPRTMVFEVPAQEHKFSSTMVVELEAAPPSLPFENRRPPPARGAAVEAPPGSPWASTRPTPAPTAIDDEHTQPERERTLTIEPEDTKTDLIERKPVSEPKVELAPIESAPQSIPTSSRRRSSDPKRKKVSSVWREDPPAPKSVEKPVAAPQPPPKTDLSRHLYRKGKRT